MATWLGKITCTGLTAGRRYCRPRHGAEKLNVDDAPVPVLAAGTGNLGGFRSTCATNARSAAAPNRADQALGPCPRGPDARQNWGKFNAHKWRGFTGRSRALLLRASRSQYT